MRGSSSPAARRSTSAFRRSPAREPTATARSECLRHFRDAGVSLPRPRALRLRVPVLHDRGGRRRASVHRPRRRRRANRRDHRLDQLPLVGAERRSRHHRAERAHREHVQRRARIGRRDPRDRASRRTRHAPSVPLQWRLDPAAHEPAGCQEVWHYHLHVFPRHVDDDLYGSRWRDTAPDERPPYAELVRNALTRAPT